MSGNKLNAKKFIILQTSASYS